MIAIITEETGQIVMIPDTTRNRALCVEANRERNEPDLERRFPACTRLKGVIEADGTVLERARLTPCSFVFYYRETW